MPRYEVPVEMIRSGYVRLEADSKEDAVRKLREMLADGAILDDLVAFWDNLDEDVSPSALVREIQET